MSGSRAAAARRSATTAGTSPSPAPSNCSTAAPAAPSDSTPAPRPGSPPQANSGTRTRIDRSHDGSPTERESLEPSISGDGRTVVFHSADPHLVPDDTDKSWNVFVHDVASGTNQRIRPAAGTAHPVHLRDLKTDTTTLVSPDPAGGAASATVEPGGIADGGRRIAFWSYDGTLNPAGDTNEERDAFVRHLR